RRASAPAFRARQWRQPAGDRVGPRAPVRRAGRPGATADLQAATRPRTTLTAASPRGWPPDAASLRDAPASADPLAPAPVPPGRVAPVCDAAGGAVAQPAAVPGHG